MSGMFTKNHRSYRSYGTDGKKEPRRPTAVSPAVTALALVLLLASAPPARATWQTFDKSDGLFHYDGKPLFEDRDGNLWFPTGAGATRFDGLTWATLTEEDGLAFDIVFAVHEDRNGDLWFGTFRGLSRYDGTAWTTYTVPDVLPWYSVNSILEDSQGGLWFPTGNGVAHYDGTSWYSFREESGLADDEVIMMLEDHFGHLWFATGSGVSRYDGVTWQTYTEEDGLVNNVVRGMDEDRDGNLWFGTSYGVSRFDGTNWTTFTKEDGLGSNSVLSILADRDGNLWFGTYGGGVTRFDGLSWRTFTPGDGLASSIVRSILEDRAGNLWFGHSDRVSRYDRQSWTHYTDQNVLVNDSMLDIFQDRDGDVWLSNSMGLDRYDWRDWTHYGPTDVFPDYFVQCIGQSSTGDLWFGTDRAGVVQFDGETWDIFSPSDGLPDSVFFSFYEDRRGDLWFGTYRGAVQYDGQTWTKLEIEAEMVWQSAVYAILEDHSGDLWFATSLAGVHRYDGQSWTHYTSDDVLPGNNCRDMMEDPSGNIWIAIRNAGVARFDGSEWTAWTVADGLPDKDASGLVMDTDGNLWVGFDGGGIARFDGETWANLTIADGLGSNRIRDIIQDHAGNFWIETYYYGVSVLEPDRVYPQTRLLLGPASLSPSNQVTFAYGAAFDEPDIEFSCSFNGEPWSSWSTLNGYSRSGVADGIHTFQVRARDRYFNVEPDPASWTFEVDATQPVPMISSPSLGEVIRGEVFVKGTAADPRFRRYRVLVRSPGEGSWDPPSATVLVDSEYPVVDGTLAWWNTQDFPDGAYELRVEESDTLGLTGAHHVELIIDNVAPWIGKTSPVTVQASLGGDVFTPGREIHLYFPPGAFVREAVVALDPVAEEDVPDSLSNGAARIFAGYDISWGGGALSKPATLEMALGEQGGQWGQTPISKGRNWNPSPFSDEIGAGPLFPALYVLVEGNEWERVGGTVDDAAGVMAAAVTREGRYALFAEAAAPVTGTGLSAISMSPRVFSPSGTYGNDEVAISFSIGRSGPVTVKVYNRAGRMVKRIAAASRMGAGANLVRWNGRDESGRQVPDGFYLVTVESLGAKQVNTLAVVR